MRCCQVRPSRLNMTSMYVDENPKELPDPLPPKKKEKKNSYKNLNK